MNTISGFWSDLGGAWTFFLALSTDAPLWLWTALVGLLMSLGVTEFAKRGLSKVDPLDRIVDPALAKRRADRREFAIETIALFAGTFSTYLLHRGLPGLLLGILVGLLAPYVWSGLAVLLRPAWAWWVSYWRPAGGKS